MRVYLYHAVDYAGAEKRGSIGSPTLEEASRDLGARGLYVVSIQESSGFFSAFERAWRDFRIGQGDILAFAQGFSVMLEAGIPILNCLDDLIASTSNPAFVPVLQDLRQRLARGGSFSQALESQGTLFPEILKTLVAVGEETGSLVESLREASEHLLRMQNLRGAVRKALMYPALAFGATLAALVFWLFFVIPSLSATLKTLGVRLPLLTRALIGASAFCQAHWKLGLLALLLAPLGIFILGKHPRFRYLRDLALIKTPLLEVITYNKLLVIFSEQFRILSGAGITMGRLFDLMIPSLGNEYFSVNLREVKENILKGARISDSFEAQKILPVLVLSKIRIGESTGTLDKQFEFLAKYYTKKLDDAIDNLGKIIEPLVMVVIGGLFAIIIMGLLLPIYDLVSKVGKT